MTYAMNILTTGWADKNCTVVAFSMHFQNVSPDVQFILTAPSMSGVAVWNVSFNNKDALNTVSELSVNEWLRLTPAFYLFCRDTTSKMHGAVFIGAPCMSVSPLIASLAFNRRPTNRECVYIIKVHCIWLCSFEVFAPVTLTLTGWLWYTKIIYTYIYV